MLRLRRFKNGLEIRVHRDIDPLIVLAGAILDHVTPDVLRTDPIDVRPAQTGKQQHVHGKACL
nr:hypothetical protein [Rhizobium leguminosarum]